MHRVDAQRHGRAVEQFQNQVHPHVKRQCPRGQPQQRMAATFVLLGPERGQQVFRVERQLVSDGGEKIALCQCGSLQIDDAQPRKHRCQHGDGCQYQQTEHGIGRLGQRRNPPQIDNRQHNEQTDRGQRDRTGIEPIRQLPEPQQLQYRCVDEQRAEQQLVHGVGGQPPAAGKQPADARQQRRTDHRTEKPGARPVGGLAAQQHIDEQTDEQCGEKTGAFMLHGG